MDSGFGRRLAATGLCLAASLAASTQPAAPAPTPAAAAASAPAPTFPVDLARFRPGKGYFNFEQADLEDVLRQVAKLTQLNFIVPQRLKTQKLTILCEQPVTARAALHALLAALEINDLALVPSGRFFKVEKRKDAIRQPVPTLLDGEPLPASEDFVTVLVVLQHIHEHELTKVLRQLISKRGELRVYGSSHIILSDSAANIDRLRRIIRRVDVEGNRNQVHIFDVRYAPAADLARTLEQVFGAKAARGRRGQVPVVSAPLARDPEPEAGVDGAPPEEAPVLLDKVIADERTNKLILVCNGHSLEHIRRFMRRLDVPLDEGTPQVRVVALENADAEELARTIHTLTQGARGKRRGKKAKQQATGELFEGQIKVTADKSTNALVIVATGRDFKRLRRLVDRLDVRRRQVFVEAVIMEMSLKTQLELGLDVFTGYQAELPGVGDGYGAIANPGGQELVSSAGAGAAASAVAQGGASSAISASNLAAYLGFLAYRGPVVPGSEAVLPGGLPSVGVVLQALQSDADVDVISTPHILTTDNEKAEILVGQNVPFAGNITGTGGGSGQQRSYSFFPMVSVQRQDVALKLAVTPHVSEDGQVRLEIEQEISDLGEYIDVGYGQTQPVTTKRNTKTTVVVDDQQTVILGGLITDRKNTHERKIPLVGDLPLLGWLFKDRGEETEKRNLLLVLTPYVIEGDADFERIYRRKLRERQQYIELFYGGEDIFEVPVVYAKKTGPYGALHKVIRHEQQRLENGGPGLGDALLVTPDSADPADGEE